MTYLRIGILSFLITALLAGCALVTIQIATDGGVTNAEKELKGTDVSF
jgi:uncharacterized protein YceK